MPFSTEMPDEVFSQGYFPSCRHRRHLDGKCQFVPHDQAFLTKCRLLNIISTPNNVFYTDSTHKNYFGNVFSAHFPIWGREIEELDRLRSYYMASFQETSFSKNKKKLKRSSFLFLCWRKIYHTSSSKKYQNREQFWSFDIFVNTTGVARENSRHLATLPMVCLTSGKRAQKFHTDNTSLFNVPTQILVALLIGRAVWEIYFNQSEALPRSG